MQYMWPKQLSPSLLLNHSGDTHRLYRFKIDSQGMHVGLPYHASYQINILSTKHLFLPGRSSLGVRIAAVWR